MGEAGLHWFCKDCNCKFTKLFQVTTELENKYDKLADQLKSQEAMIECIKEEVKINCRENKEEFQGVRENMDHILARLVKAEENSTNINKSSKDETVDATSTNMSVNRKYIIEEMEINKRRNNPIVFGIPEEEDIPTAINGITK